MQSLLVLVVAGLMQVSAFEYRENTPAALFPYARAQVYRTAPESCLHPAMLPGSSNTWAIFAGSNPYMLEGLYSSTINIGHCAEKWGVQGLWARTGIEGYNEHTVEAGCGLRLIRYVSLGLGFTYYNMSVDMDGLHEEEHHWNMRASIVICPVHWFSISFLQDSMMSYFLEESAEFQFPEWSLGAGIRPIQGLEINWNINSTALGYVNTISASANLLKYFTLSLGYSKETMSYGAAVGFLYKHISLSYGLRYHTHLGMSHSLALTVALKPMKIESINYGRKSKGLFAAPDKKIDINTCAPDELKKIPGLSELHCRRIMLYRKTMGPLSEKALEQIGMTRAEIDSLLTHACGLKEKESYADKQAKGSKASQKGRRINRALFAKLLEAGIPAGLALEISEGRCRDRISELKRILNERDDLTPSQKSAIISLCEK